MPIQFVPTEVTPESEVIALPEPTVVVELKEVDGVEGIYIGLFCPSPEDSQVDANTTKRFGKKTTDENGVTTDNSKTITSILRVFGKVWDVPLVIEHEGKTLQLSDPVDGKTPLKLRALISSRQQLAKEETTANAEPDNVEAE